MEKLNALHRSEQVSLYQVEGADGGGIEEYVFSTPETRRVCNTPELVGIEFPGQMRRAHGKVMKLEPLNSIFSELDDFQACVMHFLRGGLNFQVREALADAYEFNRHYCSYMTSQRYQRGERWKIKQDQYRKIDFVPGSTILIGDCIATGSTMENGLQVLLDWSIENDCPFDNLVVFTIGCDRGREILKDFHSKLKENFKGYGRTLLFYAEGKLGLAGDDMDLTIALPGTDLLREPALLAPEFEKSIYSKLHVPIERCAIYDVGAKSFEYRKHIEDVIEYWQQLKDSGLTLLQAYRERWSEKDYGSVEKLYEARREVWGFIDREEISELHSLYCARWQEQIAEEEADSCEALHNLADRRLAVLERVLNGS
ncbi:MAG: hypothetical protein ACLFN5_03125 [bacterium]